MNKKTIIQSCVIGVCFLAMIFVWYNYLGSSSSGPQTPVTGVPAVETSANLVLPHGDKLDFEVLKKYNFKFGIVSYPKLDPSSEIGIEESSLITVE